MKPIREPTRSYLLMRLQALIHDTEETQEDLKDMIAHILKLDKIDETNKAQPSGEGS